MKILFCVAIAAFISTAIAAPVHTHLVRMKSLSYDPKIQTIEVGDSVLWDNQALTAHSAIADDVQHPFDTGMILPGNKSKRFRFDKPGAYFYHCAVHGKTMSGQIIVLGN